MVKSIAVAAVAAFTMTLILDAAAAGTHHHAQRLEKLSSKKRTQAMVDYISKNGSTGWIHNGWH